MKPHLEAIVEKIVEIPRVAPPVPGVHTCIPQERIPDDSVEQTGACEPPLKKHCTESQVQRTAAQPRFEVND